MKSKTEGKIRTKDQKALINFTNKQFTRAFENLISGEKNIHLGERKNDLTKYASASGYVLTAMENLVNLKYAFEELQRRYRIVEKSNREKKKKIELFLSSQPEIEIPDWFKILE